MKVEFNNLRDPNLDYKNLNYKISKLIDSKSYILGKQVKHLENRLASYVKTNYCVTTSSGTDALLIALLSLNLKKNSEVITPAFSYISSAEVILRAGLKPVFVDVEPNTALIDVDKLKKKINKRTSCIIVVSLFGQLPDVQKLKNIKKKYNLPIIEDAAQSFGAKFNDHKSCAIFDIGCTSFFPTKSLGCFGDGGAIFTKKKKLYSIFKQIRQHGQKKKYYYDITGLNARLDTMQAVILLEKLKNFEKNLLLKKRLYQLYRKNLKENKNLKYINIKDNYTSCFPLLNVLVKKRNKLKDFLNKRNISTNIYYPLILTKQKIFNKLKVDKFMPISKKISEEILSLPFHLSMNEKQVKYVTNNIIKFYKK